jgi:hypothetical protein
MQGVLSQRFLISSAGACSTLLSWRFWRALQRHEQFFVALQALLASNAVVMMALYVSFSMLLLIIRLLLPLFAAAVTSTPCPTIIQVEAAPVWRTWLVDAGLTVEERNTLEAAGLRALTLNTWCLQAKQLAGASLSDRRLWRSQLQQQLQASFALKPGAAIALLGALETHASRLARYPKPAEQRFFREDETR